MQRQALHSTAQMRSHAFLELTSIESGVAGRPMSKAMAETEPDSRHNRARQLTKKSVKMQQWLSCRLFLCSAWVLEI